MSSGYGINGTTGRCYPLWREFSGCMEECNDPKKCLEQREDYFECLHHKKEFQRANQVAKAMAEKRRAEGEPTFTEWVGSLFSS